jgi:putative ABC transport system permease protein
MSLAAVLIGLFVLTYGALAVIAVRRPLLARLAFREAIRRPGQSAVVVLGLMIGTTAIFAAQVLSDSFIQSSTRTAYLAWGRVDLIASNGGHFFDLALASRLAADPGLRSSLAGVQAGVEIPSSVVDLDRGNAKGSVLMVGFDPVAQGAFGSYRLTDGKTTLGQELAPDQVLISASLAEALDARSGDRIRLAVGPQQVLEFLVAGIAQAEGPGAYTLRPAVFAPLVNLRSLIGDQGINVIRMAAPGDGRAELDRAHELAPRVRAALQLLQGGPSLKVREAKREDVEFLVTRAEQDATVFTGLSLFVALAGVALVVNLGLALAEERRPRHAVLRALGLGRSGTITLSVLEGGLYSVVASALALVPGTIVGVLLALRFQGGQALYSYVLEDRAGPTLYPITFGSVALSMAIGALIVLTTLFGTSLRSSRMQISSAIRNLPEPIARRKRGLWITALLAGLGLASLVAVAADNLPIRLVGGVGLVIVASALVSGRISDRLRATMTGAGLAIWAAALVGSIVSFGSKEIQVLGLASLVAVFGLSIVVASNLRVLEIPARWLRGGARATARPSLAYLTRRPLRAGLGTGAFALVLALITFTSVLIPSFIGSILSERKEYDIRVNAPTTPGLALPDSVRQQISREISMSTQPYRGDVQLSNGSTSKDVYLPLYTLSPAQLASEPFELGSRESRFKSDAEVWKALAEDPHLVVTPSFQIPGVTLTLAGPDGPVQFRVAGAARTLGLWGLAGSAAAMAPFAALPVGSTILAKITPGADARTVARQIEREIVNQGADTSTIDELYAASSSGTKAFTDFMRLVMGMGLLVGVLSLGILALRAVVERRRSIGVLRALGYRPGQVLAGIVSEGLITATCGMLVGIGVGVLMSGVLIKVFFPGARLLIDVSSLALIVGLIFAAVLAVTIPPALRAARLPVVEALRVED